MDFEILKGELIEYKLNQYAMQGEIIYGSDEDKRTAYK